MLALNSTLHKSLERILLLLSLSPGPEIPQEVLGRRERRLRHQLGHERRMRHLVEGEVPAEIVNQA